MLVIYNASSVGSVGGGWLSSTLINRGWTVNCGAQDGHAGLRALRAAGVLRAVRQQEQHVGSGGGAQPGDGGAPGLVSANLFTTTSDMFPRAAVGSVVGIGGAMGALGIALMQKLAGYVVQWTGSYSILFMICASMYLVALGVIHLFSPKLEQAKLG